VLYHENSVMLTDVEVVGEANVDAGDTNATVVPHGLDTLVDDLTGVGLHASSQFNLVRPALRVFTCNTLERDVGATAVNHLLQLGDNTLAVSQHREVHGLDLGVLLLDEVKAPVLVNHNDALRLVHQGEVGSHLTDRTSAPNGNDVALVDYGVDNSVPACADHVREVESLLIRYIVGKLEEVHISVRNASVLCLSTSKATSEVGVAEHACGPAAVHGVFDGVAVGALTLRGQLQLAVEAITASDLEACYHAVALLQILDLWAHLVYDSAELVTQDVTLLHFDDSSMVKVQVAATDGTAGDLEDHVAGFDDLGFGTVD
jgi:hypothetical protein